MRAVVCREFGAPAVLELRELPEPQPQRDEVAIEVHAAGVNFGDVVTIAGRYQEQRELPFVPGVEIAGVVQAVGPDARRVQVGERVVAVTRAGAFAERALVSEPSVLPLPESVDMPDAATLLVPYATAEFALRTLCVGASSVLVLGAGGAVGAAAVALASTRGLHVIAAASSAEKLAFARQAGAAECVNYAEEDLVARVRELTSGAGVSLVLDPLGGAYSRTGLRCLGFGGTLVVVGFAAGEPAAVPANHLLVKNVGVRGAYWGGWRDREPAAARRALNDVLELRAAARIPSLLTETAPLHEASAVLERLATRRVTGRIALLPRG